MQIRALLVVPFLVFVGCRYSEVDDGQRQAALESVEASAPDGSAVYRERRDDSDGGGNVDGGDLDDGGLAPDLCVTATAGNSGSDGAGNAGSGGTTACSPSIAGCVSLGCDPVTGVATTTPLPSGTACSDDNACNGVELCDGAGHCLPGSAPSVDDGNPCTADSCDAVLGVTHVPAVAGTPCGVGTPCGGTPTCDGQARCQPAQPPVLDDSNPCTTDSCDPVAGPKHTPVAAGTSCDDGSVCNGVDRCDAAGVCQRGAAPVIDDGNPCTVDTCDPSGGVSHVVLAAGTPCDGASSCAGANLCDRNATCSCIAVLPDDPGLSGDALDRSVASRVYEEAQVLFAGNNPVQTLASTAVFAPEKIALAHGRCLDRTGQPLSWVRVAVKDHPEFGATLSRADGKWDMAVNGGGTLTFTFESAGALPSHRTVAVPWSDHLALPDVTLAAYDTGAAALQAGASVSQVARGSVSTDDSGARQATIYVPANTQAGMVVPGGASQPLDQMHLRVTEYTVGDAGPQAMPGSLPPTSAYTYALEMSVDEAVAAGATRVDFSQPVVSYLENFLHFPVGESIPAGYYDRDAAAWIAGDNGRVIAVLAIVGDLATLDVDGHGVPASADQLQALGISSDERHALATLYAPGQNLWRVAVRHFTPWDYNWGYFPPPGAVAPDVPPPVPEAPQPDDCQGLGSIIDCHNQSLGEVLPLVGTPYTLHYQSDRMPGASGRRHLDIPLTGAKLPPSIIGVQLEVDVAGQHFKKTFFAQPNLSYGFDWDGRDGYGRLLQGGQKIKVSIGYDYQGVYQSSSSFGQPGGVAVTGDKLRKVLTLWSYWNGIIGGWDASVFGLGGWSLSAQHAYDSTARTLYFGDGHTRVAQELELVSSIVAGGGLGDRGKEGDPARKVVSWPQNVFAAPNGDIYFADHNGDTIRRISGGAIHTVAGGGSHPLGEHPTPSASNAWLPGVGGVAFGPGGAIYATTAAYVIRIDGNQISIVAGNGNQDFRGDGGPATLAAVSGPMGIRVAPDGTVYFADTGNSRIRKIGHDGIIHTIAGGVSDPGNHGDGGPAIKAQLQAPTDLAFGPDGSIYIADGQHRVRRIGPDGLMSTVAGDGFPRSTGDGGLAVNAEVDTPIRVETFGGNLYVAENGRLRRIDQRGVITTIAGYGPTRDVNALDNQPALNTPLAFLGGVAITGDGTIYLADPYLFEPVIRAFKPRSAGISSTDIALPSDDGRELYVFDSLGRHQRTLDTRSGATTRTFRYDSAGRLAAVLDTAGDTTFTRDGNSVSACGPYGRTSTLRFDEHGYLAQLTDPAAASWTLTYDDNGLMKTFVDPRQNQHVFGFDPNGRLSSDQDANGGVKTLVRSGTAADSTVAVTDAMGRVTAYRTEQLALGVRRDTVTFPDGTHTQVLRDPRAISTATDVDGTVTTESRIADPRFGLQSGVPGLRTVRLPSGLTATLAATRSIVPLDETKITPLKSESDTVSASGNQVTRTWDSGKITSHSAAGRTSVVTVDGAGRPLEADVKGFLPLVRTWDAYGHLRSATQGDRVTRWDYDANGDLAEIVDPLQQTWTFPLRDGDGRPLAAQSPDGYVTGSGWDASGNLTSVTPPGRPTHGFGYGAVDERGTWTPPAVPDGSGAVQYSYNLTRQLTSVTYSDGQAVTFDYDPQKGRITAVHEPGHDIGYGYDDATGHVTGITAAGGGNLTLGYDGNLVTDIAFAGVFEGTVQRSYDDHFRLAGETVDGGPLVVFHYDADSLLIGAGDLTLTPNADNGLPGTTLLGTVADARGYDGYGALASYGVTTNGDTLLAWDYHRDPLGHLRELGETVGGVRHARGYAYDPRGHLTDVTLDGALVVHYDFDDNGDRRAETRGGAVVTADYDEQDRLLRYGHWHYVYAAAGAVGSRTDDHDGSVTRYEYDLLGNLRKAQLSDGTQVEFLIDGQNRRIGKRVGGVLVQGLLYGSQLAPLAELDGQGKLVSRFVYASRDNVPDYMLRDGRTYRVVVDHVGSVRLIVDAGSGDIVQRMEYDEFGNVLVDTNPGFQPFGFAGGLYDRTLDLVRFGARDYDPTIGRWLAKDPLGFDGGDASLYAYVHGDPVNYSDVTGLFAQICVHGTDIRITIPVSFTGMNVAQEELARWTHEIQNVWTGDFGQYHVTTEVTQGPQNTVNVGFVPQSGVRSWVDPATHATGTWFQGMLPNGAAHEAGHLMGMNEAYNIKTDQPKPGWSENDIMVHLRDGTASERDINAILAAPTNAIECGDCN